jgi:hypothetical protein
VKNVKDVEALINDLGDIQETVREKAYEGLFSYFSEIELTNLEKMNWLKKLFSDQNLFYGINEGPSNKSVKRTYTLLVLVPLLRKSSSLFDEAPSELKSAVSSLVEYIKKEKDLRGRSEEIGWIHAFAHLGDVLSVLATYLNAPDDLATLALALVEKVEEAGSSPMIYDETWRLGIGLACAIKTLDTRAGEVVNSLIKSAKKELPYSQNAKLILRTVYLYLLETGQAPEIRSQLRSNLV